MRTTFRLKTLVVAIATFSVASVASAAGLDRSGQDMTAFLQDGVYAEAVYTYIDADVSGYDNAEVRPTDNSAFTRGNKTGDISEDYDFFRYGAKADINNTFSVGILYDEPFGASAEYTGDNDFVGSAGEAVDDVIASQLGKSNGVTDVQGLRDLIQGTQGALAKAETDLTAGRADLVAAKAQVQAAQAALAQNPDLAPVLNPRITAGLAGIAEGQAKITAGEAQLAEGQQGLNGLQGLESFADGRLANDETTKVEVRSNSITAILGAKFGPNKNFQVYGGPVAQRIESQVRLRGDAYGPATGYTSNSNADQDYGYLAGISYSKPEIALKAALTYRSEIDHSMDITETYPLAGVVAGDPAAATRSGEIEITTPKSVNFDFQTGLNPTTLATAKLRWVPWSDFVITPPLYNAVSKNNLLYADEGLNLVEYEDDQWQVEVGIAKRLAPALAVSGTVGWDSGAGDPTTSLGPIEGYYSVGLGAKYNVTENWAVSAGGKYLWFGDAQGALPTDKIVADFEDNDGFIAGVKLSYQAKQNFN